MSCLIRAVIRPGAQEAAWEGIGRVAVTGAANRKVEGVSFCSSEVTVQRTRGRPSR